MSRITAMSLQPNRYYLDVLRGPLGFTAGLWLLAGLGVATYGVRKDKPVHLLMFGGLTLLAGWISMSKWSPLELTLFPVAGLAGALGLAMLIRRLVRRAAAAR